MLFLGTENGPQRPPELFRRGIAPLHWLQTQGSMSSADDALFM